MLELVLYVSQAPASKRAEQTLERVMRGFSADAVRVTVTDVATDPLRAEADGVMYTPTLVKVSPSPRAFIVGDLSDGSVVTALLLASGLEEAK